MAKKEKRDKKDKRACGAEELEDDVVVLLDDEGAESKFRILFDSLFVGEKQYVVLMPIEEQDSLEPEIVILRVDETEGGESVLSTIDSDEEWEEVLKAFEEMDIEDNIGDYDLEIEDEDDEEAEPEGSEEPKL